MLNTSEQRRWALDMRENWMGTRYEETCEAHCQRIEAQCDLEDLQAGSNPTIADKAEIIQILPILGNIYLQGGKIVKIDHPYGDEECDFAEERGIYTTWEWRSDPSAEFECGQCVRMYIGSKEHGPEAQYNAYNDTWYSLKSNGNFGRRYACGGNWSGKQCENGEVPEIYNKLQEVLRMNAERKKKIEQAKARLRAAELRVKAAHQRSNAEAHFCQAAKPIYQGQEAICAGKGAVIASLADQTLAEADLIEAKAGL